MSCDSCGLVRRDPIPPPDRLLEIYEADDYFRLRTDGGIGYGDYFADEEVYRPYFRKKFRLLGRYRSPPGALLEIGAAAGFGLEAARDAGWDASGLELSGAAVEFARDRLGLSVRRGGIADLDEVERFDAIAAFQTLEHLPDVRGALRRIRAALRPDGVAFFTTPNHGSLVRKLMRRFWISYRPEHLLYFDARTLRRLLLDEGFVVEHLSADDPLLVPISRVIERAAHYYAGRRLAIDVSPRFRLPVWLGDMQVIARRT